ncbi:DUF5677 domain-containing protein, partial [Leptospira kanakyensis]|uniref:DUF5677 domain-containing protein n=1 Tax=Leptospira kanakyensis TaxID=2484968 RepID=UPI00223CE8A1
VRDSGSGNVVSTSSLCARLLKMINEEFNFLESNLTKTYEFLDKFASNLGYKQYPFQTDDPNSTYRSLFLEFLNRYKSVLKLLNLWTANKDDDHKILGTTLSIIRSALENYLIFNYVFINQKINSVKGKYIFNLYLRDGYRMRIKTQGKSDFFRKIIEEDKVILEKISKEINDLAVELNLDKKTLDDDLKQWKPGFPKIMTIAGFGKVYTNNCYHFLSSHSHSLYQGIIQAQALMNDNDRKIEEGKLNTFLPHLITISFFYLRDLERLPINYKLEPSDDVSKLRLFYYNLGCR